MYMYRKHKPTARVLDNQLLAVQQVIWVHTFFHQPQIHAHAQAQPKQTESKEHVTLLGIKT